LKKIVKGGSYIKEKVAEERKLIESWGGKVVLMKMEPGYSSSKTIDKGKFIRFKTSRGYVSFKKGQENEL
jgi:bifunctional ADP-heptose synthase (sugar kinase/adenylyltransferase)